jgi:hypothetical protein
MSMSAGNTEKTAKGFAWLATEEAWRYALIMIAAIAVLFALFHLVAGFGFFGLTYNKDIADDVVLYLAAAATALTLLRMGTLIKAKLPGGVELEFADKLNRESSELKRLAVEIEDIKRRLQADPSVQSFTDTVVEAPAGPKLPKPSVRNDQQRNRFGGASQVNGYRLDVRFLSKYNANVVNLELIVSRTDGKPVESNVRFYLHETFDPDEITVAPRDGKATLDILTYGGFTAGAWIEGTDTLLELDLIEQKGAPRIIREE